MNEKTIKWLRKHISPRLTIHTDIETDQRFIYMHDVVELLRSRDDVLHVLAQLFKQPGAEAWIMYTEAELPYLDRAIHEVHGERN